MTKNKKIAVSVLVFSIALGAGYGINQTSAQGMNGGSTLIDKLVAKFNLNKDEVTKVFDENRIEQRANMDAKRKATAEENLNAAVSKGELTAEKKQLILEKLTELEKEREVNRTAHQNLSVEERKTEMETHRAEMTKWASDNGIDVKYLMGGFGRGLGHGEGAGHGKGDCQKQNCQGR